MELLWGGKETGPQRWLELGLAESLHEVGRREKACQWGDTHTRGPGQEPEPRA